MRSSDTFLALWGNRIECTECRFNTSDFVHVKSSDWMQRNSLCSDLEPLSKAPHRLNYRVCCRCCSDVSRGRGAHLVPVTITRGQPTPPSEAHLSYCCSEALRYSRQLNTKVLHKQQNHIHLNPPPPRTTLVFQINQRSIAFCAILFPACN